MNDSVIGRDKRVHPRETVMRRGVVIHSETGQTYRCVIVDVSTGGAKLQLLAPGLPEGTLSLVDLGAAANHDLKVVWRTGPMVGVSFLSSSPLP
jgi:hypothetical protein